MCLFAVESKTRGKGLKEKYEKLETPVKLFEILIMHMFFKIKCFNTGIGFAVFKAESCVVFNQRNVSKVK